MREGEGEETFGPTSITSEKSIADKYALVVDAHVGSVALFTTGMPMRSYMRDAKNPQNPRSVNLGEVRVVLMLARPLDRIYKFVQNCALRNDNNNYNLFNYFDNSGANVTTHRLVKAAVILFTK